MVHRFVRPLRSCFDRINVIKHFTVSFRAYWWLVPLVGVPVCYHGYKASLSEVGAVVRISFSL